ncbi:VacJ family lipoprotein [Sphingomonas sp.]|uniref:MlaA family lipoprotein n=1 Tax=Sphingomonas sp. TaxID=28214 RepID=UPI00334117E3
MPKVQALSSFALSTALLLIGPPASLTPPAPVALVATDAPMVAQPSPPVELQATPVFPAEQDIVVTGSRRSPTDPLQSVNVESFAVTQAVDLAVIRPVAKGYEKIVPSPARDGIRNILNNLREPVTFLNFLLQHKIGRAAKSLARFAVNSTIGVAGLIDIARRKPFKLPLRPNGFANTLGFYGVKPGAFLFVPLVGPTTVRDLIGTTVDRFMLPFVVGGPFKNPAVTISIGVLGTLDQRAQLDETLQALRQDKQKAYQATREFYLARRQAQIDELHGKGRHIVRPNPGSVKPLILDAPEQK